MGDGDLGVAAAAAAAAAPPPLESRPGIVIVGPPNVGKRTILSRLLPVDLSDALDTPDTVLCHGWTIDTKYYSADVSIWTVHLHDAFSLGSLPVIKQLAALIIVFDLSDLSSFTQLQNWVSSIDVTRFDVLLCIGNKADLVSGHFAHVEYRRFLQKHGEFSSDPSPDFSDYGILESDGSSLLGDEEPSLETRKSCLDWCLEHNIEYVEACASNAEFDKCLSLNGDMQGISRLHGALSAHMWPGMILKSGNQMIGQFALPKEDESDDDESEIELEYEILSGGFDEQSDENDESWCAFTEAQTVKGKEGISVDPDTHIMKHESSDVTEDCVSTSSGVSEAHFSDRQSRNATKGFSCQGSSSNSNPTQEQREENGGPLLDHTEGDGVSGAPSTASLQQEDSQARVGQVDELNSDTHIEYDDLEHLMSEIGNVRDNLRLMPDYQRREMAAKLAMKMAAMFGCSSDDESFQ